MPARPEDLAVTMVSTSSDESSGSDDVFESFNDDGNEADFLRTGLKLTGSATFIRLIYAKLRFAILTTPFT